jgi:hypothetical protein
VGEYIGWKVHRLNGSSGLKFDVKISVCEMFTVHFVVTVPSTIGENELVFVVGSDAKLGDWNPSGALRLDKNEAGYG